MVEEIKNCKCCNSEFSITENDLSFYKRMNVPSPTFCPDCRSVRRMFWRNERNLFRRVCGSSNKKIISMFPETSKTVVYDRDIWWKDTFDPISFGKDYDFSITFFQQFINLFNQVPLPSLLNENISNSSYCNCVHNTKNGYLLFASMETENVFYSTRVIGAKDSMDLFGGFNQESCYENVMCDKSQKLFFSERSAECLDSMFLLDCKNLNNCIACVNLRNKSYCIFNEQYTKEEYKKTVANLKLNTNNGLINLREKFNNFKLDFPKKYANIVRCFDVTGDNISNSKNCKSCFDAYKNLEDCAYGVHTIDLKDSYDGYGFGDHASLMYEVVDSGVNTSNFLSTVCAHEGHDLFYSYNCHSSSNCFGCVSLRSKQYCIINKQYTKEEYEEMVPKIIKHMNDMPYISERKDPSTGSGQVYKYGEFFPTELSPFAYNETIAQEYYPLTKQQAIDQGYRWKDKEERNYDIDIYNKDIPDDINDTDESIINKVIECAHKDCNHQCTEAFKIIPEEYQFYKRMNLPLPRLCPNCRHYERLSQRNPLKLWHRSCMKEGCTNTFETSYSPDRPEIIYCERCYQQEVY